MVKYASKMVANALECWQKWSTLLRKWSQMLPKRSKMLPKWSNMFRNGCKCFRKALKCLQKWSNMLRKWCKCFRNDHFWTISKHIWPFCKHFRGFRKHLRHFRSMREGRCYIVAETRVSGLLHVCRILETIFVAFERFATIFEAYLTIL